MAAAMEKLEKFSLEAWIRLLIPAVLILAQIDGANSAKLSEPKILLPYHNDGDPTSYKIDIHDSRGCFTWRSTRPDIAAVTKQGGDLACTNSVIVTAVSKSNHRMTTILLAENAETGEVLRCDVIVDEIAEIGIETTTRELFLEDSPEKFQLFARDQEGNTFSTLEGVPFVWSLHSDNSAASESIVDAHQILRILTFEESDYDTPEYIAQTEAAGLQGDTILVEGVKTGSAFVHVKLSNILYKTVKPASVRLIVIANVMLIPQESYIILFSELTFTAQLIKQGTVHDVPLPSDQYHLSVVNSTVCSLDSPSSTVTGEALGLTDVILVDKNMPSNLLESVHQPSAAVYVVLPAYIVFSILPGRKWTLQSGNIYEISIELSDKQSHRITSSQNIRMMSDFVKEHFEVLDSSLNGTYHVVRTRQAGKTNINAHLRSVIKRDGSEYLLPNAIRGVQPLHIYDPIVVAPQVLAFPWSPEPSIIHLAPLQASGGSGEYSWTSNSTLCTVTSKGVASTQNKVSISSVTVSDQKNSAHSDTALVYVVPPESMEFDVEYVEQEVGEPLDLPVRMFGRTTSGGVVEFSDCRSAPLSVTLDSGAFRLDESQDAQIASAGCMTIRVIATSPGPTRVTATYVSRDVKFVAKITIAAFSPLKAVNPESETILSVKSERELVFEGGPEAWVVDPSRFFQSGSADSSPLISLSAASLLRPSTRDAPNRHRLVVECKKTSDLHADVTLTVGNTPTPTNRHPATRSASIAVYCMEAANIALIPRLALPEGLPPCPVQPDSTQFTPVYNHRNLVLEVVVTDSLGRRFDNFTSLPQRWKVSDEKLVDLQGELITQKRAEGVGLEAVRMLRPRSRAGQAEVSLTVSERVSRSVKLDFVEPPRLEPDEVSLYNHPNNRAAINITGGSGHFVTSHTPKELARVAVTERRLIVTPRGDGELRVVVRDVCLDGPDVVGIVHISGVHRIVVSVRDKVELGSELILAVKVEDHTGKFLPMKHFPLMSLQPKLDPTSSQFVQLTPTDSRDPLTAVYTVRGAALGTARVLFTAQTQPDRVIMSNSVHIQVFPPLRLDPRNVTLIPGTRIQLRAVGGPQPQSVIEFSLKTISGASVAEISGAGLVEAESLGQVSVTAEAVGMENGRRVVYSTDCGSVYVVRLAGVKLFAPLSRLLAGSVMPLYVTGRSRGTDDGTDETPPITPFSLANAAPSINYDWSNTNPEVVSLRSVYHASNIELPRESRFSVQLVARRPGDVTVSVRLTPTQRVSGHTAQLSAAGFSDEIHVQVVSPLELLAPPICAGTVLVTPNTRAQLRTNLDAGAQVSYRVLEPGLDNLHIDRNGELQTGSQTGQVNVLIEASEPGGANQSLALLIQVKPVHYLMLNCDTALPTSQSLTYLPVGLHFRFSVSHHDDLGRRFHFVNSLPSFRPNRYDIVQVSAAENSSLDVQTANVSPFGWGGTALRVWQMEGDNEISDYVNINTQTSIDGPDSYTVGDVFCPKVPFKPGVGTWSSSGDSLVYDSASGVFQAVKPSGKPVSIYYHIDNAQATSKQVGVSEIKDIAISKPSYRWLSLSTHKYEFIIQINGRSSTACSGVTRPAAFRSPFRCDIELEGEESLPDVHLLFKTEARWNPETGEYTCNLIPAPLSSSLQSLLAPLSLSLRLSASHADRCSKLLLPLIPSPLVITRELYVSAEAHGAPMEVIATPTSIEHLTFSVEGRYASLVTIGSPERADDIYKVSVTATGVSQAFDSVITVKDELSLKSYDIPLYVSPSNSSYRIRPAGPSSALDYRDLIYFLLACIVVCIACLIAGYLHVFSRGSAPSTAAFSPQSQRSSPISSLGSPRVSSGDTSPFLHQRMSTTARKPLWSSGYDPQEASGPANSNLFSRSPSKLSPGGY